MTQRLTATIIVLAVGALAGAAHAEVFVYPKPGVSQDQFQRDQFDCHNRAHTQTGFNPSQTVVVSAPPPQRGGAIRGAAGGATIGAIGGAIGGDAGKGAAIGAGVGAAAGLLRQGRRNAEAAQATQQVQMSQQAGLDRYNQAYGACLAGRGYQVR